VTPRRDDVRRRRRDRRAQLAVLLLAVVAGVVAGLLGTHKAWERKPASSAPTTTSAPASVDSSPAGP
jgi:hypothetical protein